MDAKEFEDYIEQTISAGFVTMAIALGTETGLFKVMCQIQQPETAKTIAEKAGLKERYVREWLGGMVAAKIVGIDAEKDTYFIPAEYQRHLLSKIPFSPALPAMAKKHQDVVSCFRKDGPPGFDYSDNPQFFEFFHDYRMAIAGPALDFDILPHLSELKFNLGKGSRVCDVGCGTGVISVELAKRFPEMTIIGIDSSVEAITTAKELAKTCGLTNVTFEKADVTHLPESWTCNFDWLLAYVVVHDLPDPSGALREMRRLLKEDGILSIVETELHSQHSANIGDLRASQAFTESMYVCLPCGLSSEPFGGFGAAWGLENAFDFLQTNGFVVQAKYSLSNYHKGHCHIICRKK